ncbi:MAG TPA: mycofactocin biosynthesis peptidyl-dipeptidase MftE [Acidimicrobiales bacterium]|nr:mycofactocin biosynthesis peptidyl-dipeptidase MftE [Acidimicrobiales bacterium]
MTAPAAPGGRVGPAGARRLAELASPDVVSGVILAVPIGATEQHGPHLPLGTDTEIACALAERLAAARPDVVVAPALPYGSSGEHAMFPGTLSIGQDAFERVVTELVRSADAFAGTVLVCAHGGNAEALARAVATLSGEGRRVLSWSPRVTAGDAHAGRTETSLMLAIAPTIVRSERAAPGDTRPLAEVGATLRSSGVAAVSPNGVLGDPTGASAAEGTALLDALAADLVAAVEGWAG